MEVRRDDDLPSEALLEDSLIPAEAAEVHRRLVALGERIEALRDAERALWGLYFQMVRRA